MRRPLCEAVTKGPGNRWAARMALREARASVYVTWLPVVYFVQPSCSQRVTSAENRWRRVKKAEVMVRWVATSWTWKRVRFAQGVHVLDLQSGFGNGVYENEVELPGVFGHAVGHVQARV